MCREGFPEEGCDPLLQGAGDMRKTGHGSCVEPVLAVLCFGVRPRQIQERMEQADLGGTGGSLPHHAVKGTNTAVVK